MPVWDRFLTERDKEHLRLSSAFAGTPRPFGARSALLIVDDYHDVLGEQPEDLLEQVKTWPLSCGREGWAAIEATKPLLEAGRAARIPIVFTVNQTNDVVPTWLARETSGRPPPQRQRELAQKIPTKIAPRGGELVITKSAPSAFAGTSLLAHLVAHGIDTLIVCGETTSGCVRASVVDAATNRFRVGVVEECTFDRTEAAHAINLFDMHQKYAKVISLIEARTYFEGLQGR